MKRIVSFLLVALLVMSVTLCWGADKKNNQSGQKFAVAVKAAHRALTKGDSTTFTVVAEGGKLPITLTCDGKSVTSPFSVSPDSTHTYLVIAKEAGGSISSATAQIQVLDPIYAEFEVMGYPINRADHLLISDWEQQMIPIYNFKKACAKRGIEIKPVSVIAYADTASKAKKPDPKKLMADNQKVAKLRLKDAEKLTGDIFPPEITDIAITPNRRGWKVKYVETQASVAKRLGEYNSVSITNQQPPPPPVIEITKEKLVEKVFWGIAPNELSLGVGQQFGEYAGPIVSLGATWGHTDSTGFLFSIVGTVGQNSVYHDFKETYGLDGVVRYNIKPWLGAGVGGGYFYWADVINNPTSENYKKYRQEFSGLGFGPMVFVGPISAQYLWAVGRYDDRRNYHPSIVDNTWQRHARVSLDPIKFVKMIF